MTLIAWAIAGGLVGLYFGTLVTWFVFEHEKGDK